MGKPDEAVEAYRSAVALQNTDAAWFFQLGRAAHSAGDVDTRDAAYKKAVELDKTLQVSRYGVGIFYQRTENWEMAAACFARQSLESPSDAELHYRLGMAHDRNYNWPAAIEAYRHALSLDPARDSWHYRLGFVLERSNQLELAAAAYTAAIEASEEPPYYWSYRLGSVLAKADRWEQAVSAFLARADFAFQPSANDNAATPRSFDDIMQTIDRLKLLVRRTAYDGAAHEELAVAFEEIGDWNNAAAHYAAAIDNSSAYPAKLFFRQGFCLAKSGRLEAAAAAFIESRILRRPFGVGNTPTFKRPTPSTEYVEFSETLPLWGNAILFESFHGASISCNPRAILEQVVKEDFFRDYRFIVVLNDTSRLPAHLASDARVCVVKRESSGYRRHLATAKYLINNNTFPAYFNRRDGQQYLNTWHGVPIKTLGRHIKGEFMEHRNAARNFLQASHMISPNRHTSDSLMEDYDVAGLFAGRLAETGYPRVDRTLNMTPAQKKELSQALGLDPEKRTVLYAPTWRGTLGNKQLDTDRLVQDLQQLGKLDFNVLFRGHSMIEGLLGTMDLAIKPVPPEIDTNDLLAVVDHLVTDYSSIAFDFMPKNQSITYYCYDLDEYASERGFSLDVTILPGVIIRSMDEVIRSIEHPQRHSDEAAHLYYPHEDGKATRRTIDFFFHGDRSHDVELRPDRPAVLFFAGPFIPNGITSSIISLLNSLAPQEVRAVIVIDADPVGKQHENIAKVDQLSAHVQILGRTGGTSRTPEEQWIFDRFIEKNELPAAEMWAIMEHSMAREFRRVFGEASFSAIVNFEGYTRLWGMLLGIGSPRDISRLIFLHNDMENERVTRFPYLKGMINLYRHYDRLISPCDSVSDLNMQNTARIAGVAEDAFVSCHNLIVPEEIDQKSREPVPEDIAGWASGSRTFVTVGRLSPEKGHSKLINAFARVHRQYPDTKLMIVGGGPLLVELQIQIDGLGLSHAVKLIGMVANPIPYIVISDCFVFSSNYEGQGIVLLEALHLGKPAISTNVVGPCDVLKDGHGLLVENSEEGLSQGMLRYLRSELTFPPFDSSRYVADARDRFYSLLAQ
ncbi:CDP-glycerol glycerophosphotransferase family protein [Rhizobium sp. ARZ01]|nr:CDP-glycerol glycerophosphotransferase family protein [Rhizobium sp. ARZ01]